MSSYFNALVAEKGSDGRFKTSIIKQQVDDLPENDVLIRVHYSSLNYKDALSATGNKGITKKYPHVPGIDAAGIVEESESSTYSKGDQVIVTGYDLGQNTSGGFGQYIRVPAAWIVPLPAGLSLQESMIFGTAGLTAAIGIHHFHTNHIERDSGPVLVTGATGGVGTLAVAILSKLGYHVVAATGKLQKADLLKKLGASEVIDRNRVQDSSDKLLLSAQWQAVFDTVGGIMLDTALRQTKQYGTVVCCGNILGAKLNTNIYPFILRGITLAGISSQNCPMKLRKELWAKLATAWKANYPDELLKECILDDLSKEIEQILKGKQVGRVLVNLKLSEILWKKSN